MTLHKVFSEPVLFSKRAQLIGTRLISTKTKTGDGKSERFKAQSVAQGYVQTFLMGFCDTEAQLLVYPLSVQLCALLQFI